MTKSTLSDHTIEEDRQLFAFHTSFEDLETAEIDFNAEPEETLQVVFGIELGKKGWQEVLWVEVERDNDWATCSTKFRGSEVVEVLQELEDTHSDYDGLMMALEEMQETLEDSSDY